MILGNENGQALTDEWMLWRVVLSKIATLEELDTHWSLDDLVMANLALMYQDEISIRDLQKQKPGASKHGSNPYHQRANSKARAIR